MANTPERYSPPPATVLLARPAGLALWLWAAWVAVGLSSLLSLGWLFKSGLLNPTGQQSVQWLGASLGLMTWCACWVAIGLHLRTDRWQQAVLRHRGGRWTVQNTLDAPELPVEVHLYIDMQRWLLVRLKDDSSWHWLWLRDNTPTQTQIRGLPPADLAWQNLRQALVASRAPR